MVVSAVGLESPKDEKETKESPEEIPEEKGFLSKALVISG